ncbi:MAG: class I SAM-dependent methyltransferase, partial [Arenicellales bacterium]
MKRTPLCVVVTYAAPGEDGRERRAPPESTVQALVSSAAPSTIHGRAAHVRSLARTLAEELADNLALPYAQPGEASDADICLVVGEEGLFLHDNRHRGLKPLRVDFESAGDRSRKQPLGRAIGRATRSVVDATAGWGHDSRRLCAMGCEVTAVERNPLMSALLQDAALRARRAGRGTVPEVAAADSIDFLAAHPGSWDCVYLDPMFPPKPRASTLSKRP